MEKDKEWKDRFAKVEAAHAAEVQECHRQLEASETEKSAIKRNYDSQIKMLTEHLVDLQS